MMFHFEGLAPWSLHSFGQLIQPLLLDHQKGRAPLHSLVPKLNLQIHPQSLEMNKHKSTLLDVNTDANRLCVNGRHWFGT